jgi:hypothetical protein
MKSAKFLIGLCAWGSILGAVGIAAADDSKPAADAARAPASVTCMHDTGTRLKLRPNECSSSPGRSYTRTDIDRTGQITASGALRLLDPSVTIH